MLLLLHRSSRPGRTHWVWRGLGARVDSSREAAGPAGQLGALRRESGLSGLGASGLRVALAAERVLSTRSHPPLRPTLRWGYHSHVPGA